MHTEGLSLFPSQQACLLRIIARNEGALFADTGTGKTAMAITWLAEKLTEARIINANALWVAPLSVHHDVQTSLERWLPAVQAVRVNRGVPEIKPDRAAFTVYIVNYEYLLRDDQMPLHYMAVIFDESHRLKGRNTTMRRALKLAKDTPYRLIMTGTPWTNNVCDVWGQFHVMFGGDWSYKRYSLFEQTFAIKGGYMGNQIIGVQNLDMLQDNIARFSGRLSLSDLVEMPPQHEEVIRLKPLDNEIASYLAVKEEEYPNALAEFVALHRIVSRMKVAYTAEYVRDRCMPVLVICAYIAEGIALSALLNCPFVNGNTPQAARDKILSAHQTVVCQISCIAEGVTLTKYTHMVFNSCNFRWGDFVQVKARIFRLGQTQPVLYTRMEMDIPLEGKQVDRAVWRCMDRKTDVITALNDGSLYKDLDNT